MSLPNRVYYGIYGPILALDYRKRLSDRLGDMRVTPRRLWQMMRFGIRSCSLPGK